MDQLAFLAEAGQIADHVRESAILADDGSLSWICLASAADSGRLRVQPMGHKLYSGRAGVALFLAASALLGRGDHLALVHSALMPLRTLARNSKLLRRFSETVSIGMGDGLCGIIYAMVRIGRWIRDETLLEDAALLNSMLTQERLEAANEVDVLSGQAGAILGLSCLFEATSEESILAKVRSCAERLLDRAEVPAPGQRAWRSAEGIEAGFAHGAGGIATALFRATGVTGDRRFANGGEEALAFDRARFRENKGSSRFPQAWCRGMPGFALALLACRNDGVNPNDEDLDAALEMIASGRLDGPDHICCGHMGRAETLLVAGQRLGRVDLIEAAGRIAAGVMGRYHKQKGFSLHAQDAAHVPSPSLFQGTSGIGYQLLRLAVPSRIPSLLLFE
jgi:lantibiotic modifying enzyme